ncbi:VanZ family protein [Fusibacter ferrireducens]|uniref:VanZ family protein n=1 Tax=Fusibacter ferrireducens TaxID=2785058 RepID=A0ABR9ZXD4_9FIRM|nr:VanZ family protein [Fusibacter ferrireducens]MBF4695122.1 VanZ family protein [Fusibacter ferrireducens]
MIKILKMKKVRWLLVVFWMLFIFAMSHLNAAKSWILTGRVMVAIEKTAVGNDVDAEEMSESDEIRYYSESENIMIILRKTAHVIEFWGLSLSVVYALSAYYSQFKSMGIGFIWSFLYACFDEAHQLLIPGRTANVKDVGIDTIGILLGILLIKILWKTLHDRRGKLIYED